MTSRQRLLAALNHKTTDRVPLDLGGTSWSSISISTLEKLKQYLGIEAESRLLNRIRLTAIPGEKILERFNVDVRLVMTESSGGLRAITGENGEERIIDEWGIVYQKHDRAETHFTVTSKAPLRNATTTRDIKAYNWPEVQTNNSLSGIRETARQYHKNGFGVVLHTPLLIITLAQALRGMTQFLEDSIINQKFLSYLLDKILDLQLEKARMLIAEASPYFDVVTMGDDLSHQDSLFYSPGIYRKLFKPIHKKVADFLKNEAGHAKVLYHCCGAVEPLIQDLIDIGVDALNPVQVNARGMNDTKRLKTLYGKDLTFWGGIDTQKVLPLGTPDDVENEVHRRISDLSGDGGFVLAAVHNLRPEVSPENICRMFDAAIKYGSK